MRKTLFLSLAPNATQENGHDIIYQKCLVSAARRLNLSYVGLFPKDAQTLPRHCLPFFRTYRLLDFLRAFSIRRRKLLFLESFTPRDFLFFAFASLLFSKPTDRILILFRYAFTQGRFPRLRQWLCRLCARKLKSRWIMLTDSDLIAEEGRRLFHRSLSVLPIPHAGSPRPPIPSQDRILCWWPGPPRSAKGLADLLRISHRPHPRIELIAAQQSRLPHTTLIPDVLTRDEYLAQLHRAHIILLPYDPIIYRSGTSGIFVEAILAGKLPLVKAGSWLARELLNHNLPELVIDWASPSFFDALEALLHNPSVGKKLKQMQHHYAQFHSQEVFTDTLERILSQGT